MFLFASLAALSAANAARPAVPSQPAEAPAPVELEAPFSMSPQDGEKAGDGKWHGSVNVGFNNTAGNTRTTALSASANAQRKIDADRYSGSLYYNYNQNRPTEETIQDNYGIGAEYNRFVSDRLYALAKANLDVDQVAQLDQRTALGVGAGYQIYETEDFDLNGELGVAAVDEDYAVDASDVDYTAAQLGTTVRWQVNEDVSLDYTALYLQSLDESDDLIITSDLRASTSLGESMVASAQYFLNYDNTPVPGNTRADHRVVLTVGWTF